MDREKVVSHLQIINTWATVDLRSPKEPIWSYRTLEDVKQWTDDALALLKEQEAVEPIKMQRMDDNFSFFVPYYLCGNCRYELVGKDVMFCHHCGRLVKWE